MNKQVLEI